MVMHKAHEEGQEAVDLGIWRLEEPEFWDWVEAK
jgi:hypothetical protein